MKEFHGRASKRVDVMPQAVFDLITNVTGYPDWNAAIEAVIERPSTLAQGVRWTVKMHPPHVPSWGGVSQVEEFDRHHLRCVYVTRNADGNPSYTKWAWTLVGSGDGTEITVSWDVYPDVRPPRPSWALSQAPAAPRSSELARGHRRRGRNHRIPVTGRPRPL